MHLNKEILLKWDLEGKTCRKKWVNKLVKGWVCPCLGALYMFISIIFKDLFSKTAWPIQVKFYRKHLYDGESNVIINKLSQMTKMAAMPIYGKIPSKIFFAGTAEPIATKLYM